MAILVDFSPVKPRSFTALLDILSTLPWRSANYDPSWLVLNPTLIFKKANVPSLLVLQQGPHPCRLGKLEHVAQASIINFPAPARGECHLAEHGRAPVRVRDESKPVIKLSQPGSW
ncbi:hypothetical protein [Lelliottia jeotgali]